MTTKTKTHLKWWTLKVEMHNAHIGLWNWKKKSNVTTKTKQMLQVFVIQTFHALYVATLALG